ncbi:MAG TPA: hypothetical protein VD968_05975 [Pyrinomonadaceae bacterium]|nr:hypothetical protein [Pyrinomonadaceae bacterium]
MGNFLEALGGQLADRRAVSLLVPAVLFWGGGLGAYLSCSQWALLCSPKWAVLCSPDSCSRWPHLRRWLAELSTPEQWALLLVGLLFVLTSAVVAERMVMPTLRLLEGYWPGWLNFLQRRLVNAQSRRAEREQKRLAELAAEQRSTPGGLPTREKQAEYASLEFRLLRAPSIDRFRMPTELGNILRVAEMRPQEKYGLNSIVCWPRLWLLLPDGVKQELGEARSGLDAAVRSWLWSLLFLVWVIWAWWAVLVGLLGALFSYRWAVAAAAAYGDLLESAYDLHRWTLYAALRWPAPRTPADEKAIGEAVTKYLRRGSDRAAPVFVNHGQAP